MPAKSKAELKYLFVHDPRVAKEFADATPDISKLPEHVKKKAMGGGMDGDEMVPCMNCGGMTPGYAGGGMVESVPEKKLPENFRAMFGRKMAARGAK